MTVKTVLVSGAGGFIGRWSVPPLIANGYRVHALLGRSADHAIPLQIRGADIHHVDLLDPRSMSDLLTAVRPSHLLHFAWIATPGLYSTSPDNYRWLAATQQLLECFAKSGGVRAVMAGTCAEYDWTRGGVCDERSSALAAADRITPYAECKIAMQQELERFGEAHGVSTAWGRIFFQYGPDEHPDRLVASVIGNLLRGREALCSHGRQIRDFLHVADVGAAFSALLDSGVTGPVNLGSGNRISLAQLLGLIASQIGRPELLRLGARATPAGEPSLLVPDVGRLRDEVGWRPRWQLREGIADTIVWRRQRLRDEAGAIR